MGMVSVDRTIGFDLWSCSMSRPTPIALRRAIRSRARKGQTPAQISAELGIPERTVRRLLARFRDQGDAGIGPGYRAGQYHRSSDEATAREAALVLRRNHPKWGAGFIRVHLKESGYEVPSTRTIQRWLRAAGLTSAPPGRPPRSNYCRARAPHDVWQMDAAERLDLKHGQASWLRITDECTGAVLWTAVFPPRSLGAGWGCSRQRGSAEGICTLGAAEADSSRQRNAMGLDGGPAHGTGSLVDRPRNWHDLEPASESAPQRRCREVPRRRQKLGRTKHLRVSSRTASSSQRWRPHPARRVSGDQGSHSARGVPQASALEPTVQPAVGVTTLGSNARSPVAFATPGTAACRYQWKGLDIRPWPLGEQDLRRTNGLGHPRPGNDPMGDHGRKRCSVDTDRCGRAYGRENPRAEGFTGATQRW